MRGFLRRRFQPILFGMFLVVCWVGSEALAQEEEWVMPTEAQELIAKSDQLTSYRAQFSLEAQEGEEEPIRLEGDILFQRPNQRRLEIRLEGETSPSQILVSNGQVEWQYAPEAKTVYRIVDPPDAPGPHRPFSDIRPESLRFVERIEDSSGPLLRFEATPSLEVEETTPIPIDKIQIDVGESDGIVRKTALLTSGGEPVLIQTYRGVQVNVSVEPESFAFVPPRDVAVVEIDDAQRLGG